MGDKPWKAVKEEERSDVLKKARVAHIIDEITCTLGSLHLIFRRLYNLMDQILGKVQKTSPTCTRRRKSVEPSVYVGQNDTPDCEGCDHYFLFLWKEELDLRSTFLSPPGPISPATKGAPSARTSNYLSPCDFIAFS